MARNDGIDRTVARNQDLPTPDDVAKIQEHNEREKDSYSNQDIVPERTPLNVHFKTPTDDYVKMFEQMEQDGVISTRGLKPDAIKYGELVFDVNSAYFYNHGGYEFAKQFYADAYKAAVEIVGGEQYILSAVMHADEHNRAMSEALGEDVYHYHLHVVYIPVVEKQILWSKRCKDEALRGTVKETITQVSRSKKWDSKPVLDEDGNPKLNEKGKKILRSSYSVLQDDFFNFMRAAGYTDVAREICHLHDGERGQSGEGAESAHHATVGAETAGIGIAEEHALTGKSVEIGRHAFLATKTIDHGCAEALKQDDEHVGAAGLEQDGGVGVGLGIETLHHGSTLRLVVEVELVLVLRLLTHARKEVEGGVDG